MQVIILAKHQSGFNVECFRFPATVGSVACRLVHTVGARQKLVFGFGFSFNEFLPYSFIHQ